MMKVLVGEGMQDGSVRLQRVMERELVAWWIDSRVGARWGMYWAMQVESWVEERGARSGPTLPSGERRAKDRCGEMS